MFRPITSSIGAKIILGVVIPTALILLGMIFYYSNHEEHSLLAQNRSARMEMAQSVIHALNAVMLPGSLSIAQQFTAELQSIPGIHDFRILRSDGSEAFQDNHTIEAVNFRRGNQAFAPRIEEHNIPIIPSNHPALQQALTSQSMISFTESEDNERLLTFLIPIPNNRECHRCHSSEQPTRGLVKLTTTMEPVYLAIQESRNRAFRILAIALTVMLLLVSFMVRRLVVAPLTKVTNAMTRVAAGDLHLQIPQPGSDELSLMAKSFNHMTTQLLHTHTGFLQEHNKLTTIILSAREGIIVTDHQGTVVLVNPSAERLLDKTAQQIAAGGFLHILDNPDYITNYMENKDREHPSELVYKSKVLSVHAAQIMNNNNAPIGSAALIRDITEEKRLEEELRIISYIDKLTNVFNRRRMEELLNVEFDRAYRYGYPLALLFFDVDHFKQFNDTHGHDQGDRVLQTIGKLMNQYFRKVDSPCRYGGEEFCVILPSTPAEDQVMGAWIVAERFRQCVENQLIDGLQVTISIGVAIYPHTDITAPSDLIKLADDALYKAKKAGRNCVIMAEN